MAEWTRIEDGYPLDDELVIAQFRGGTHGQLTWLEMGFFYNKRFYSANNHYVSDEEGEPVQWFPIPQPVR